VEEARSYLPGNMHDLKHELAKVNELIDRADMNKAFKDSEMRLLASINSLTA